MIISHKHRFVFVEVPHTASHSIAEQLIKHYGGQPILRKHSNITQFLGQASPEERRYFKFATVRNPLDTATTDYAKLAGNHRGQFTNPAMLIENGGHVTKDHLREFNFIRDHNADFPTFFKKFRNKLYNNWFLIGDRHYQQIIRFERLQEDFSSVLENIGIEQVEPIPHVNRTVAKRKHYTEFYTPDTYAQAARCYGPFMKKWRYEFPAEWGPIEVPRSSEFQFKLIDGCAQALASRFTLDPDNPALHRIKKFVDTLTRG